MFRYPDSAHRKLKAALSQRFGFNLEEIACGAGSDELISLLVRLFAGPGDEVLFPDYSFIMFLRYALRVGATPVAARTKGYRLCVDGILERVTKNTSIVLVANPNNPTGSYLSQSEIQRLAAGIPPDVPLVLDCAYADYVGALDYNDGSDLLGEYKNIIVLHTFSKLYALASLRIGWCFGPSLLVDKIDRLRGPYNISGPSQLAAAEALFDDAHTNVSRQHNSLWRSRLTQELSGAGFRVEPSGGNFITVIFDDPTKASNAYEFFFRRGILTRPLKDYSMPECIRITIGRANENEQVLEAFSCYVNT